MTAPRRRGAGALALAAALACGVLLSVAFPPAGLWPLAVALVPVFGLVAVARTPGAAYGVGFAFALGFFVPHIGWLPASLAVGFGPAAWLIFPPLVLVLAIFWGLMTGAARLLGGRGSGTLLVLPGLWILVEWARTQGYFGFPWGALGYTWTDTPVAQLASWAGVYGLGLLTAVAAALLAAPFVPPRRPRAGVGAGRVLAPVVAVTLVAAAWGLGAFELRGARLAPERSALLVQGNIDPFAAVRAGPELRTYLSLTELAVEDLGDAPDLVVWPEGAATGTVLEGVPGEMNREQLQAAAPDSAFVVGGRRREPGRSYNSVYSVADGRLLGVYDKRILVPFGERFPGIEVLAPVYRSAFSLLGLPMLISTYAGEAFDPLPSPAGTLGVYVCYESVFPQSTRLLAARGAEVLVTVTNDAWFARGGGARQHWDMGRMRAIETRRWIVRAANDGITGAVDPYGREVATVDRGLRTSLAVPYGLADARTPWSRYGDLTPWILLGWVAIATGLATLRRA